jgi:predicted permease
MIRDLRHALRMLLRAKGWTAVVVLSLALGIGANTALFSAVNGLLLKSVEVTDPNSLVRLRYAGKNDMVTNSSDYGRASADSRGRAVRSTFSYPMYKEFVARNETMVELLACAPFSRVNLNVDGQSDVATSLIVSGNYYTMLGVQAELGRTLLAADDKADAPAAAVISHRYWQSRFGGNPSVVGKSVQINSVPATIVGVLSPGYVGIQTANGEPPDVSLPLELDARFSLPSSVDPDAPPRLADPMYWWLQVVGRLKPGVTAAQVEANLGGAFRQSARAGFDAFLTRQTEAERLTLDIQSRKDVPDLIVDSAARGIYDAADSDTNAVTVLSVVVALVLLIVCANVANLLLSRAATRRKEISVRQSLGATRARLVRQLLTESLLLSAMGGGLGVLIGYWGQQLLPGAAGRGAPLDWRVMLFVVTLTVATGILFGIAPALGSTRLDVSTALKENSRSVSASRGRLTKGLLILQVAVSLVLLIAAGLFLRTLQNLRNVDVGFNPRNIVLFRLNPAMNRYDPARTKAFYAELLSRLPNVPGVRSSALASPALLSGSINTGGIYLQGRTYVVGGARESIHRVVVSPDFFQMMEIPLLLGRGITDRDVAESPKVAVINEAAVRKFFPEGSPIGRRFGPSPERSSDIEVIGVLKDAKYDSVRDAAPPTMYVPFTQTMVSNAMIQVRTAGNPLSAVGTLREAVRQIDPNMPLTDISTQEEQIERRYAQTRVFAQAYTVFGCLALLLASIGLFGLMSYSVARRTNEIGIRMALGARAADVQRMVMAESLSLVAMGVAIGLAGALAAGRFVAALLFGLQPTDMFSLFVATATMVVVAGLAAYIPARRAARVDPMTALRCE